MEQKRLGKETLEQNIKKKQMFSLKYIFHIII